MEKFYINVGGTIFVTTRDTLSNIPFFSALLRQENYGFLNSNIINPYFIDRNAKAFNCLLNMVQNKNYTYPKKYEWDLDFWGLESEEFADEYIESMHAINIGTSPLSSQILKESYNPWLEGCHNDRTTAEITLHRTQFAKSTHCFYKLTTVDLVGEWSYNFIYTTRVLKELFICLPKNIPIHELCNFTVEMEVDEEKYSHSLDLCKLIYKSESIHGWHYLRIFYGFFSANAYILREDSSIKIKLIINKPLYSNIQSCLKYNSSHMANDEYQMYNGPTKINNIRQTIVQYPILNDEVVLQNGYTRYLIWKTSKKIDIVKFTIADEKQFKTAYDSFSMTRGDFQYLERRRVKLNPLPKKYGSVYFCCDPDNLMLNSGGIEIKNEIKTDMNDPYIPEIKGVKMTIKFPQKTEGTVWQICYTIFQ